MEILGLLLAAAAVLFGLYLLAIRPARTGRVSKERRRSCCFAHRGLHDNRSDAPENSLLAFERAIEAGYGIEMDVRLTRDGVPVIFHDASLKRMCGYEGHVEDMTHAELKEFRLLGTDQRIPDLQEVLKLTDGKVPLLIEYKMDSNDASVCICAERLLKNYRGFYCMESFHPFALLWYWHNRPEILRGILSTDYSRSKGTGNQGIALLHFISRHLLFNFFTKPDFIAYDCMVKKALSRKLCRKVYGSILAAWTVKSPEQLKQLEIEYDWFIFEGFMPTK